MNIRPALLLAPLLALVVGSASAQSGNLGGRATSSFNLSPITAAEARAAAGAMQRGGAAVGSAIVRNLPRAARVVSWAGVITLAPGIIQASLDYLYNEAKLQSGSPELDAWRSPPVAPGPVYAASADSYGRNYLVPGMPGDYFDVRYGNAGNVDVIEKVCGVQRAFDSSFAQIPAALANAQLGSSRCSGVPPVTSTIPNGDAASAAVASAVNQYITAHPERVEPSITYSPTPTANQVAGAIIDPTIDSNGDGIPDGVAGAAGLDAGDPGVHPDLTAKVTTVTNPDGSVTKTTTTYDLNGTPHVTTSVYTPGSSATTSTATNANGSVTTITTTATVNPNGTKDTVKESVTVITTATTTETATTTSTNTNTQTVTEKSAEHIDEAGNKTTVTDPTTTVSKDAVKDVPKDTVCTPDQAKGTDGTCASRSPANPGDSCGDFSLARTLAHPASVLRDVFLPCTPLQDLIAPALLLLKGKFPFSLAASLNGWFQAPAAGQITAMPTTLGPIPLDFGWLTGLWALIKTLVGIVLWTWFVYWLIDRFTPRAGI